MPKNNNYASNILGKHSKILNIFFSNQSLLTEPIGEHAHTCFTYLLKVELKLYAYFWYVHKLDKVSIQLHTLILSIM